MQGEGKGHPQREQSQLGHGPWGFRTTAWDQSSALAAGRARKATEQKGIPVSHPALDLDALSPATPSTSVILTAHSEERWICVHVKSRAPIKGTGYLLAIVMRPHGNTLSRLQ